MTDPQSKWSDAWILASLIQGADLNGRVSLTTIIAVADFINHAILTYEELRQGLWRLETAGYITRNRSIVRVSRKAIDLYAFIAKTRSALKIVDSLNQQLNAAPKQRASQIKKCKPLSRAEYKNSVEEYLAMHAKVKPARCSVKR